MFNLYSLSCTSKEFTIRHCYFHSALLSLQRNYDHHQNQYIEEDPQAPPVPSRHNLTLDKDLDKKVN